VASTRLRSRLPRPSSFSLHARLVFFSTLLTAVVLLTAFVFVSFQIRRNARALIADELAQSQQMVLNQQIRTRRQLLRTSGLVTENSTLRAAIETYRLEALVAGHPRPDLIATIQHEVEKISSALGQDLLVVTDDSGIVLAANAGAGSGLEAGASMAEKPVVRHALEQNEPVGEKNFAVLTLNGQPFQVSCVPIVLQGYIIGTLTHGDRLDDAVIARMQEFLGGEIVIAVGGRPVASTLPGGLLPASLLAPARGAGSEPATVSAGEDEYVTAELFLGRDEAGAPVHLHLLHSLTHRLGQVNRSLFLVFLTYGAAAVALAGLLAALLARSILRPMNRFVGFMRSVAASGDFTRRYEEEAGTPEVATLDDAYDQLMDSLHRTREELSGAREDLVRLERLKEAEKMAALGRMLSGAAHEINNPLTAVVGNVELLLSRGSFPALVEERLQRVLREGRRVASLVKNLLRLSRRSDEVRRPVSLNQVVEDSLSLLKHDFTSSGARIESRLADGDTTVLANELELQQIFVNFLQNAYDAVKETGRPAELLIRTEIRDSEIAASVSDNGPGIADPSKIFEPFYTTKEIGKGTGLGLSICHGIAEGHGGRITAANRPEGGACMTLRLPIHRPARDGDGFAHANPSGAESAVAKSAAAGSDRGGRSPKPPAGALEGFSALVVEDEPAVLEFQLDVLHSLGARAKGVRSGASAIASLEKERFDLVITDMRMPGGVSGQDLFRWIERHRPADAGNVIFVTGDTMGTETQAFLAGLPNRCLVKPFSVDDYAKTVNEVLHEPAPAV